jgi:cyclophilin family peptidyl-prolyl cis-trans isomerase
MAQRHKAATEVTIAPTEESPMHDFVQRFWMVGALLAVLVIAAVLGQQMLRRSAAGARAASWDRLREDVDFGSGIFAQIQLPSAATLGSLSQEIQGTPAGPWARALEVQKHVADGDFNAAAEALRTLSEEYPHHPLVAQGYRFREDGSIETLEDHLYARMDAIGRWEREHPALFENPPLPEDCPKVRLQTTKGSVLLGLYQERAPKHVENFLKLCGEGFYDGTLFHRSGRDFLIQGGDPNSRDDPDKESWGLGGPGYKIEPETSDLRHFRYVLAMAKNPTDTESSGSQFYLTVGTPHHLDGVHTVFGAVLEGQSVVDEIAAGEIEAGHTDRPRDPVAVVSTEVVAQ